MSIIEEGVGGCPYRGSCGADKDHEEYVCFRTGPLTKACYETEKSLRLERREKREGLSPSNGG